MRKAHREVPGFYPMCACHYGGGACRSKGKPPAFRKRDRAPYPRRDGVAQWPAVRLALPVRLGHPGAIPAHAIRPSVPEPEQLSAPTGTRSTNVATPARAAGGCARPSRFPTAMLRTESETEFSLLRADLPQADRVDADQGRPT
jgi:hypothetical protein